MPSMHLCVLEWLQNLFVGPLSGYGKVTVEDKAWATVHVGIFGFDLDIFRAELCYKGEIGYDLNILAVSIKGFQNI